ncbi:diguanylate cyclase domain-containing protein [Maridesulfovibrio sp.]|uniref:GGDEF domain-containing protein n=1 Tax=unclassified Maridesulfovibrio TaxID=2794999 RepID=UPI003AFFC09C
MKDNSLVKNIVWTICRCYIATIAIVAVTVSTINYKEAVDESTGIISRLGSSFAPQIALDIQNSNERSIESSLENIKLNQIVESVELVKVKGESTVLKNKSQVNFLNNVLPDPEKQSFDLRVTTAESNNASVGTLIIQPGKGLLIQKISSGLYTSFLNLFFGLLAIIAATAFICRRILTKPLRRLTSSIENTDPASDLTLPDMSGIKLPDEIKTVRDKINALLQKTHQMQATEKQVRHSLEQMVRTRTAAQELASAKLDRIIHTDALSGLSNRQAFDSQLQQDWTSSQRSGTPLALLMIDIDNFNKYNENYGYQAGDECISTTAGVIESSLPNSSHTAVRYSGNKFAVILPRTDLLSSRDIATMISAKLAEQRIAHYCSETGHVTISIGISEKNTHEHESPQHLVAAADKALHRSKEEGRNSISIAAPEKYN